MSNVVSNLTKHLEHVLDVLAHSLASILGIGAAHLLHESLRVKNISSKVEVLDDNTASSLRKLCLTYYDFRALILDLALNLDMMRNLAYLSWYQHQVVHNSLAYENRIMEKVVHNDEHDDEREDDDCEADENELQDY